MAEESRPPVILVADDVPANVELLSDQLETLGFTTIAAVDGPEALALAIERRPDLCILDVAMPAGSLGVDDRSTGFEVCRRLKRDPRTGRIPVIFVTALNDTTDRVKGIEAGGDDFLTKPHNRLVLGARVRSLLKLKAATDALEESYRKLRELEKVRDDLMKMIVHDLKTPLTSVLATLEMVGDGDFGPVSLEQRRMLGDAEFKANELLALIGDLLEVAKVEETGITLERQPIAPGAFLAEVVHEWHVRFTQEGASVVTVVADDAPTFEADKPLLKRVFSNLLQNALTHSGKAVELRLTARAQDDGIIFAVQDNGPGIPAEYQELIFQKFGRVKTGHVPRVRSSGLGLAFCKLVVDAHGGAIWVKSGAGEGSTFYVRLPARHVGSEHVRVYVKTFGCRANHYDSEQILHLVASGGATVVADPAEADVAVFNSCAVTADAVADVRQAIRRAARKNPRVRSIVTGCAAATSHDDLASLPRVAAVIGGADTDELARVLGVDSPAAQRRCREPRARCSACRMVATSTAPSASRASRAACSGRVAPQRS